MLGSGSTDPLSPARDLLTSLQTRLREMPRRPFRYANQLPESVEAAIVSAKREKPHWGARKIRERLLRRLPHAVKTPAASATPL
jgi:hypothetical protein